MSETTKLIVGLAFCVHFFGFFFAVLILHQEGKRWSVPEWLCPPASWSSPLGRNDPRIVLAVLLIFVLWPVFFFGSVNKKPVQEPVRRSGLERIISWSIILLLLGVFIVFIWTHR